MCRRDLCLLLVCCRLLFRPYLGHLLTLLLVRLQRRLHVLRCGMVQGRLGWSSCCNRVCTTGLGGILWGRSSLLLYQRRGSCCHICSVGLSLVLCRCES